VPKSVKDLVVMNAQHRPAPLIGRCPSVVLVNPKHPANLGQAWRACSGFGVEQLWFTGDRMFRACAGLTRLPREERMKGYKDVTVIHDDRFLDRFDSPVIPVCVEVMHGAEDLTTFAHPKNALYIFGPEDGSVPKWLHYHCHRFLGIPTDHCLNLAAAVCTILYDRRAKRVLAGLEPNIPLHERIKEQRGFISDS